MDVILIPIFQVIMAILSIYEFIVIATVILTWLFHFNIVNYNQQLVRIIADICYKLTEPFLARIRRFMPDLGGIDLSPIVLLLLVFFLKNILVQVMGRLV